MTNPQTEQGQPEKPVKKKKRGCCFGCLMLILILVVLLIGTFGYYWYQGLPKKSAVEKEYNSIPDRYQN
jgi:uncharacterized protein HemX